MLRKKNEQKIVNITMIASSDNQLSSGQFTAQQSLDIEGIELPTTTHSKVQQQQSQDIDVGNVSIVSALLHAESERVDRGMSGVSDMFVDGDKDEIEMMDQEWKSIVKPKGKRVSGNEALYMSDTATTTTAGPVNDV